MQEFHIRANKSLKEMHFTELTGHRILIVGDVGSGKTSLTARLLTEAIVSADAANVTVIDMAPQKTQLRGVAIGGRLTDLVKDYKRARLLVPAEKLHAPRIEGHTANEVAHLAKQNSECIEELLDEYMTHPTPILFINDISMYLMAGNLEALIKAVSMGQTVVANSYEGVALKDDRGSGVSERERKGLATLKRAMDTVLSLSPTVSVASVGKKLGE